MNTIPKSELKDGQYYINKNSGRGMRIGLWDAKKQMFHCIKPPEFGHFSLYEMPHKEDEKGYAFFDPISVIELPQPVKL